MYYLENHGNIHENAGKSQQISGISQSFFSGEVEVMEVLRNPAGFLMHPGQVPEFIFAFLHVKKNRSISYPKGNCGWAKSRTSW